MLSWKNYSEKISSNEQISYALSRFDRELHRLLLKIGWNSATIFFRFSFL